MTSLTGPSCAAGCSFGTAGGCAASAGSLISRGPLRAADDTFSALSFAVLAECARQELRASGVTNRRHEPTEGTRLTPQELEIARLAADGLSNREIGQRLYISHRTVGYHLHRIFPKLGITSRSQLHATVARYGDTAGID